MTTLIGITSIGAGVRYGLVTSGDDLIVLTGATIASSDSWAIVGGGSRHAVNVAGSVFAGDGFAAISLGNSQDDFYNSVNVMAGGLVAGGSNGVSLWGNHASVRNHGTIFGDYGVSFAATVGGDCRVFNTGLIDASIMGVSVGNAGGLELINFGTISGGYASIFAADAADNVRNRGLLSGAVYLGGGDDLFDNRGGRVEGSIIGGIGNDTFILGADAETVDGGDGIDTLDFRTSTGVWVSLDNTFENSGRADGDSYVNVENVYGSAFRADRILGNDDANELSGNGGEDLLIGKGGNDRLSGGYGLDTLSGEGGSDAFVFNDLGEMGDLITDFTNGAGNDDSIRISASIGGGLSVGMSLIGRFVVRADNQAQDADDRFIVRTTDKTLWFDADGTAAGGAVLVADLQQSAVLYRGDIVIF